MEIIDSHTHFGPSVSLGTRVTTEELLGQAERSGVDRIVIFPFPSQALADERINDQILKESRRVQEFIPYYYIPDDLRAIPRGRGFYGGKWHWTRGVQDSLSNYEVLKDPHLREFIEESEEIDLPIIVEEEFGFTQEFMRQTKTLKVIIPHLGMLGGDPMEFLKAFRDRENVYFDTALANPSTIVQFIRHIGAERLLFGSDIPFGTMKGELDKITSLPIGDEDKELILSCNIKTLLRLV
jgi:predicted TIM-barrel fold metal-dependent hydrolase